MGTKCLERLGAAYTRQWLAEVMDRVLMLNPEPEDYVAAASLLDHFPDQRITLTDALMAVLSRRLRMPVWTFDRHFGIMRIKQWCARR